MPKGHMNIRPVATRLKFNVAAMERIVSTNPQADKFFKREVEKINKWALRWFNAVQRDDNEWRLSETTPPKYMASFRIRKLMRGRKVYWQAYNDDPASTWVEYGAMAGGRTKVLGYKPYSKALGGLGGK